MLVLITLVTIGLVVLGFIVPPPVPNPFSKRPTISATAMKKAMDDSVRPTYTKRQLQRMARVRAQEKLRRDRLVRGSNIKVLPLPDDVVVAFSLGDDPHSIASLEKHIGQIDVLIPSWFELPGQGCDLAEQADAPTRRIIGRSDVLVMPRLANIFKASWRGRETAAFLKDDQARACLIPKLMRRLIALGADGVNVDFEDLQPEDSEPFLEFLVELARELHKNSLHLTVDVSVHDPAYDIEYIGDLADAVMIMAYDEHFPSSLPGPIASRDWFLDSLVEILPRLPPERVVVVLGSYGYDWNIDDKERPADSLSFRSAMDLARAADAKPIFEPDLENGHFGYRDPDEKNHDVWFQDAPAIWNQVLALRERNIGRVGLWRLGTEDETLWTFLGEPAPPAKPNELVDIPPGHSVEYYGSGEVITVRSEPRSGTRDLEVEPNGHIDRGLYTLVPSGFLVERRGRAGRKLVLSFDDGPSEVWTPRLLDALQRLKTPATFFVIGDEAMRFPDLVEREAAEGHIVGNHTFRHPHLNTLTPREVEAELSITQRLIEGLSGARTPLFRAPYTADIDPDDLEAFASHRIALEEGYLVVGANVDSQDWKRPGARAIADRVVNQVTAGTGQIILMHDAGGDRSQTVESVSLFVPALRSLGYEFVSLDRYLGIPRSELVRSLPLGEHVISWSNAAFAIIRSWGWTLLAGLFFVCTILAILRILFLGSVTIFDLWRRKNDWVEGFEPLVTVLIPAYNEEKVIGPAIRALLDSEYENLEIVVVDDGSKDRTVGIVSEIAKAEPRVRLVRQPNRGKAAAANHGLAEAWGDIVVAVDADTLVPPRSIPKLVRHFADPGVTAVCGNVEVGNVRGVLTAFQAIEYVTSQNFDRRAFSALNCISVVPGALGAWRRSAVLEAGGYSQDTLTEDADLTLTILERGGRVVYEADAGGRTEAPETLAALARQRFRWTYGTYQCLWKHQASFFRGTLGWLGLPNIVLFQILFPTLSPIGDIVMLLSIFRGDWKAFLAGYLAFLVMDLCGSLLAFTLDRKPIRWLILLIIQRFSYRQIMYYVSLKALIAALKGARHGWRKLDRTGSVSRVPDPAI